MTTHLLTATYGLSCLIGGFLLGRIERATMGRRPARERWNLIARLALAAALVFFAIYTQAAAARQNACYLGYFTQVSASLADRSAATGRASAAELAYLDTIAADGDVAAARTTYAAALRQLESDRRAAPLPQPPSCR